jgi:hypothetical protein
MRAAAALSLTLSLLAGGCFPNNAKHRTIAKIVEGGVAVGGVVLLATVNTGADCMGITSGDVDQECEDKAQLLSSIGLGMILTGLVGFIVTVSTSPDDKPEPPIVSKPTPPAPEPALTPAPAPTPPAPETPPTTPEPTPPGTTPTTPETPTT